MNNPSTASRDLLEKYSRPGPRYTSYPTAPHFHEGFGVEAWREELAKAEKEKRPLSLYFHLPFCDTLCYFCGCNMIATHRYHRVPSYIAYMVKEMEAVANILGNHRVVEQLHWGGGTPTFLHPDDINLLAGHIRRIFGKSTPYHENAEIGCEIDPRELTRAHLEALRSSGFNRVSFGVQDLDPKVQKAVNRIEPESMVREVYAWARELGFHSINLDLMTGLPHQTVESFSKTLDVVLALSPDRLAVFAYAHLPQMIRHQNLIPTESLPDFNTRLQLQLLVRARLTEAGYINIGMDHYAKPTDEMVQAQKSRTLWRNFQGYTTHKDCDIIAFGVSAISQTATTYCQNQKKINDYEAAIEKGGIATMRGIRLNQDDLMRRDAISRLMCHLVLDFAPFDAEWKVNFREHFAPAIKALAPLADDGLLTITPSGIHINPLGVVFIRNIAMAFDAYLDTPATHSAPTDKASKHTITITRRTQFSQTI